MTDKALEAARVASREEGHYWVRWGTSQHWEVMYWRNGYFWGSLDDGYAPDGVEIGPRVFPPGSATPVSALPGEAEVVAFMHPTSNWAHVQYSEIDMHCPKDGPRPIPLVTLASLQAMQARAEKAERERDELSGELYEEQQKPWPEWAKEVLKAIRKRSGYDGYDDADGVDLPSELEEAFSELEAEADRHTHEVRASKEFQSAKDAANHYRSKVTELCARITAAEARVKELEEALEPFARHLDEMKFDLDNHGNELPDEQTVGWVYVTNGDFRRARSALKGGSNG